jgi:GalNAc-alpha-(1->4)-GalNAc-alpha-(1->3)-diNAcBac-PP-undecaprenol alpha-1,4-N-acetyl-D-galactosaminyltransferase
MLCLLANELSSRGYNVHIITWDPPGASSFYLISDSVQWHRLDFREGFRDKARRAIELRQLLLKYQIRTMIGFVMSGDMTVFAAALTSNVRIIAAERNAPSMYKYLYTSFRRWLNFNLLRLSEKIIVQSESFKMGYPSYLTKKIVVIPNPVMKAELSSCPGGSVDRKKTLLCVGRLEAIQKRPQLLLEAFGLIASDFSDWNLFFVGDGDIKDTLFARIKELKLESQIYIFPTTNDISSYYAHAQIFVMPSAWEGFPNALAEAMSHGLPAIGFEGSQGVAPLISESSGWLARGSATYEELAKVLRSAMSDPDERVARGVYARRAMESFSTNKIIDGWQNMISDLEQSRDSEVSGAPELKLLHNKKVPLITVGVTVYNAQNTLASVLDSIHAQTWSNMEIIVVDDCSTDQSYRLLQDWKREEPSKRCLFQLEKNSGVAVARNKILTEAKGEFVAFFDDDDTSHTHRLSAQWARIIKYEREYSKGYPVICHSARLQVYPSGETRVESTMGEASDMAAPNGFSVAKRILLGKPVKNAYGACATCSQMARVSSYKLVGGFDPDLRRSEDTDLIIRLAIEGAHFPGIAEPLVTQTMTATSDKTSLEEYTNMVKVLTKQKTFISQHGSFDFALKWLTLKFDWNKTSKLLFVCGLLKLLLLHPTYTIKRIFMAIPRFLIDKQKHRFQSDLDMSEGNCVESGSSIAGQAKT